MLASAPATMTTSACPVRMAPRAKPMAWALDEQAVEIVKFGPFAPHMIARTPEAELSVTLGMKFGCDPVRPQILIDAMVLLLGNEHPAHAGAHHCADAVRVLAIETES